MSGRKTVGKISAYPSQASVKKVRPICQTSVLLIGGGKRKDFYYPSTLTLFLTPSAYVLPPLQKFLQAPQGAIEGVVLQDSCCIVRS